MHSLLLSCSTLLESLSEFVVARKQFRAPDTFPDASLCFLHYCISVSFTTTTLSTVIPGVAAILLQVQRTMRLTFNQADCPTPLSSPTLPLVSRSKSSPEPRQQRQRVNNKDDNRPTRRMSGT